MFNEFVKMRMTHIFLQLFLASFSVAHPKERRFRRHDQVSTALLEALLGQANQAKFPQLPYVGNPAVNANFPFQQPNNLNTLLMSMLVSRQNQQASNFSPRNQQPLTPFNSSPQQLQQPILQPFSGNTLPNPNPLQQSPGLNRAGNEQQQIPDLSQSFADQSSYPSTANRQNFQAQNQAALASLVYGNQRPFVNNQPSAMRMEQGPDQNPQPFNQFVLPSTTGSQILTNNPNPNILDRLLLSALQNRNSIQPMPSNQQVPTLAPQQGISPYGNPMAAFGNSASQFRSINTPYQGLQQQFVTPQNYRMPSMTQIPTRNQPMMNTSQRAALDRLIIDRLQGAQTPQRFANPMSAGGPQTSLLSSLLNNQALGSVGQIGPNTGTNMRPNSSGTNMFSDGSSLVGNNRDQLINLLGLSGY